MHSDVKKKESIVFHYELLESIKAENIELLVDNGVKYIPVKPKIILIEENQLVFEHTFKRRGFYDVHLFIDSEVVATYTFSVKK